MITSSTTRHSPNFNNVKKEIKNRLGTIIVTRADASNKSGETVNESVYDNFPTNKTYEELSRKLEKNRSKTHHAGRHDATASLARVPSKLGVEFVYDQMRQLGVREHEDKMPARGCVALGDLDVSNGLRSCDGRSSGISELCQQRGSPSHHLRGRIQSL
jgi:hypothetical protein